MLGKTEICFKYILFIVAYISQSPLLMKCKVIIDKLRTLKRNQSKNVFILLTVVSGFAHKAFSQNETNLFCLSNASYKVYNQIESKLSSSKKITVTTWNVYKYGKQGVFKDIQKLYQQSDLLLIQEAVHTPAWENSFTSYMPEMSWVMYKSFCQNSSTAATGVLIGARSNLNAVQNLLSPGTEPVLGTHKASGVGYITVANKKVLIINTHALNFNLGEDFENHIDQIVERIKLHTGPVIWGGDFNTWNNIRTEYLVKKASEVGLFHAHPAQDDRFLKLDHIFYRGLSQQRTTILNYETSDHYPVQTVFTVD